MLSRKIIVRKATLQTTNKFLGEFLHAALNLRVLYPMELVNALHSNDMTVQLLITYLYIYVIWKVGGMLQFL